LTAFSRSLTNNLADLIEWAGPASNYRILAYKISPKSDISRKYGDNDFHDGRRPPCLIQIFKKKLHLLGVLGFASSHKISRESEKYGET